LLFLNWGLETKKWQFLIRKTIKIKWISAFNIVMTGITLGFITPNRIGEIPARAILLKDKKKIKDLVVQTSVGAYAQLIVTILLGTIASIYTLRIFYPKEAAYINISLVVITTIMLLSYFFQKHLVKRLYKIAYLKRKKVLDGLNNYKRSELFYVLFLSVLRYLVFSLQFYLVLRAFGFHFFAWEEILLIPLCFLVTSIIPTILISETGVRGSVALFIFGTISNMEIQIVMASILLWLINVAVPALLGLFNLKELKLLKEK
jgi:uncharacterized protein (TIRG00374 family)